jgi:signal transduction histidine kinase
LAQLGLALNQMADGLERRSGDLRQVAERLSILHEMDSAILEAKSPDEIAFVALSKITQIIHCVRACVVTFDFETHEAVFLAFHANGETRLGEGARVSLQVLEDVEFETLRRGKVHLIENARSFCQSSAVGPALRAHVPLVLHGQLIGSLNLELDEPEALTPDHVRVAGEVADSLAVAIHNVRLLKEVRVGHERLQALSHRLIEVQEAERRTIARELHDEIGQSLTSVKINLQTMQHLNDSPALATHLEDGIRIVDRALDQVRGLSFDLRPSLLDELGLVPALRSLLKRQAQRAGFQASLQADPTQQQIPPQVEIACFRIVQESLTNVMRHAQAQQVVVELRSDPQALQLLIRDDGAGFDVPAALQRAARGDSLGLLGMEERAVLAGGRLTIRSTPGQGTEVRAHFPWPQTPTGAREFSGGDAA